MRKTEKMMHWRICANLNAAGIKYRYNRRLRTGVRNDSFDEYRAFIDFLIIGQNDRPALIVEVKKDCSTHTILTAIGQCVFYSDYLSLSRLGEKRPFPNAIICTPPIQSLPCDLEHTIGKLGIEHCWEEDLASLINHKLETGACVPNGLTSREQVAKDFTDMFNAAQARDPSSLEL